MQKREFLFIIKLQKRSESNEKVTPDSQYGKLSILQKERSNRRCWIIRVNNSPRCWMKNIEGCFFVPGCDGEWFTGPACCGAKRPWLPRKGSQGRCKRQCANLTPTAMDWQICYMVQETAFFPVSSSVRASGWPKAAATVALCPS